MVYGGYPSKLPSFNPLMRIREVFFSVLFTLIIAVQANAEAVYPIDSDASMNSRVDTVANADILFLAQDCPSADLFSLEDVLQSTDSNAITDELAEIIRCLPDTDEAKADLSLRFFDFLPENGNSTNAMGIALWLADYYASGNDKTLADAWLNSSRVFIRNSDLSEKDKISLFELGESTALKAENYSAAIDFYKEKVDLNNKKAENDVLKSISDNQKSSIDQADNGQQLKEKRKVIARKKTQLHQLHTLISDKKKTLNSNQGELLFRSAQVSALSQKIDSVKKLTALTSGANAEYENIARIQTDEFEKQKMYGMFGFAILLLVCIPSVYIGSRRSWTVHSNLKTYSEQLNDLSIKVQTRESLADLGQLSQNVARQITFPISTIERLSTDLLSLLENIDPVLNNESQLSKLNLAKQAIESIHEKGSSAERVVRTMLIHSSTKTESVHYKLNELISDCLLLFNQSSIEYAEGSKDLTIDINRPAFQRILLSILNQAIDEIHAAQKIQPGLPKLIRIVTNASENNAIIRITHNGAEKAHIFDDSLLSLIAKDSGVMTENIDTEKGIRTIVLTYPLQ